MKKRAFLMILVLLLSVSMCSCITFVPSTPDTESRNTPSGDAGDESSSNTVEEDLAALLKEPVPFSQSGKGNAVVEGLITENEYTILHFTHFGEKAIYVYARDSKNKKTMILAYSGNFEGSVLLEGKDNFELEIEAEGEWTVDVVPFHKADDPSFSGKGFAVTDVFVADTAEWIIKRSGWSNFIVEQYFLSDPYELIVNSSYNYDSVVEIKTGIACFLVIESYTYGSGDEWEIRPN